MSSETKANVLLVDDDKDICTVLGDGLQKHGFNVTALDNPRKAVDEFSAKRYHKVILDVKMPGITGFQLAKQIWAKDPDAQICFLSAFEIYESEAKKLFKDLKSTQFIKKPIPPRELAKLITENMQSKQ